jgi:ATPase subunit of ABC transporter with duplicated ATPase domains
MTDRNPTGSNRLCHSGNSILSASEAAREASQLAAEGPSLQQLASLARGEAVVAVNNLVAGYGNMEIVHNFSLRVGVRQSLCLVGPNGAGKSTVLHSIYGFSRILSGSIVVNGDDVTRLPPNEKLKTAGIAYILQDNSVFPDMTVEENLLMGGFLMAHSREAKEATETVLEKSLSISRRAELRDARAAPRRSATSPMFAVRSLRTDNRKPHWPIIAAANVLFARVGGPTVASGGWRKLILLNALLKPRPDRPVNK